MELYNVRKEEFFDEGCDDNPTEMDYIYDPSCNQEKYSENNCHDIEGQKYKTKYSCVKSFPPEPEVTGV